MTWQAFSIILPYLISALISVAISFFAFRWLPLPGARHFGVLTLFEAEWTLAYVLQTTSPDLAGKIFWNNVQFLGAVIVPAAYCYFGLSYSGHRLGRSRLAWGIILWLAAVLLGIIWTDGLTGLFRTEPSLTPGTPFSALVFIDGPLFNLYTVFAYGLIILGTAALGANYVSAPRVFRLQVGTVLVGILIPWITTIVTWLGWVPVRMHDITPLTFGISNLVVAWALFRYRLFDLVPVAHSILVEAMQDGVIVLDSDLRIVDLNQAAQQVLGLKLDRALGKPFFQQAPAFQRSIPDLGHPGKLEREIFLPAAGQPRYFEATISDLQDNRRTTAGRLIVLRDITGRKEIERKLQHLAITDPLTGIFNRRHFYTLAEREWQRSRRAGGPLSVILFDVDHFKAVNDTCGHQVGDQVLQTLTGRCQKILRVYDVIGRYGGEEFVILLPETNLVRARLVGERLRAAVAEQPFETSAGPARVTISVGVACLEPQDELTLDKLIDQADQAMYEAKRLGRNQVFLKTA